MASNSNGTSGQGAKAVLAGRRLHFVGIGGAGMSGLALVAARLGAEVTGTDQAESNYTKMLSAAGIRCSLGHDASKLPAGAEVVVSTAIPADNPELLAARGRGSNVFRRGELLAELTVGRRCVAVAGAHGKTTTAAMIAHCLVAVAADPAYLIGGEVPGLGGNAGWGTGWLVVEGDESDGSFLLLEPDIAVVTNVELDHHATYPSYARIEDAFRGFLGRLSDSGTAVFWNRSRIGGLVPQGIKRTAYDIEQSPQIPREAQRSFAHEALLARDLVLEGLGSRFSLVRVGETDGKQAAVASVRLMVPGAHNVLNALAALAAVERTGADLGEAASALESFTGVGRRFEQKGWFEGAAIYDDYAHHPSEVTATLEAARRLEPRRLVVVFQPHLYSRTLYLAKQFGTALAQADVVVVMDVYPAREKPVGELAGVSGKLVADAMADAARGRPVYWCPTSREAEAALRNVLREGDLVLTLGAGDVHRIGEALVDCPATFDPKPVTGKTRSRQSGTLSRRERR